MDYEIDFSAVNEWLRSEGYEAFPFETIQLHGHDNEQMREAVHRYQQHLLDWISKQEK